MNKCNTKKMSKKTIDETGNTRGKWTVIEYTESRNGTPYWLCQCECGTLKEVSGKSLRSGDSRSCGCTTSRATLNRLSGSPEHRSWCAMKTRCYNRNAWNFKSHGARGITICDRWRASFLDFLSDMGNKPSAEHSIERKDNDGHYSCGHCEECVNNGWPANCKWATTMEQCQNTRKTRLLSYNGETYSLNAWARKLGITHSALRVRLENWTLEKALTEPPTPSKERTAKILSHDGHVLTVKEWSLKLGMPYSTLCYRLRQGLSIEQIIECYVH